MLGQTQIFWTSNPPNFEKSKFELLEPAKNTLISNNVQQSYTEHGLNTYNNWTSNLENLENTKLQLDLERTSNFPNL